MAKYKYVAQDENGKRITDWAAAASSQELYKDLRQKGLMLISYREVIKAKKSRRLSYGVLSDFCRELGTLIEAGVSLVRALSIITRSESIRKWQRDIFNGLVSSIKKGNALSAAMEESEGAFPELLTNMIKTAEHSGNMGKIAIKMGDYYGRQHKLNKRIYSAFLYPSILLVLVCCVVAFLVGYVIPQLSPLLSSLGTLPMPTRILLGISGVLERHWLIIILTILAVLLVFAVLIKKTALRIFLDKLILHIPYFGRLLRFVYSARFARAISSLYNSGQPIASSLTIGSRTLGNKYIEKQFDDVVSQVKSGRSLSYALGEVDGFVAKLADTTLVGEETGRLSDMLTSTADNLEFEAEEAMTKMLTVLEPVLIIIMGLIVGFVMISIMLPVYRSYSAVGGMSGL